MAKTTTAPARAQGLPSKERKRFRIAKQGKTEAYSMQFSANGKLWETSIKNLDLKQASKQLDRLKMLGCPTAAAIVTI